MFLLPYSVVGATVRKWPAVTLTLIALNVVSFLVQLACAKAASADLAKDYRSALAYQTAHAYLVPPPVLVRAAEASGARALPRTAPPSDVSDADIEEEQQHLDQLCTRIDARLADDLVHRFGFTPKKGVGLGLVTYMFLHAGLLHLLGNMWFLWLASACIEDRWGWHVFTPFYLASGVVAALAHMLSSPWSTAPLVGASGAIAGVMGAFLVLFATRQIRFVYAIGFRPRELVAPAYVMLPIWLLAQVVAANCLDGESVAYWAHTGGFVFGAGVAVILRATGADKWLDAEADWSATAPAVVRR